MKQLSIILIVLIPVSALFSQTENWVYRYDGPANQDDRAVSIAYGEDGNIYAAGYSTGIGRDFIVISINPAGDTNWTYRYNGTANSNDEALSVVYGGDGQIYAAGVTRNIGTYEDFTVISLTPDGDTNWTYILNRSGVTEEFAYDIVYGPSGHVYAVGKTSGLSTYWDYTIVCLDSTGSADWVRVSEGPGGEYDCASAVIFGENGYIYTCGYLWGWSNNMEFAMIGVNQSGLTIAYHCGLGTKANSLMWGPFGNIYTTGYRTTTSTGYDILTKRHSPQGSSVAWYQGYDGPAHADDRGHDIACGSDDHVYVAGYSAGVSSGRDFTVLKYDAYGSLQWDYVYDGIGHQDDIANSIVIGTDGTIYSAGYSSEAYSTDAIIISLTPGGDTNWVYHYNGPGNYQDIISDLVYDNATTLYAAGYSYGTTSDFTVISLRTVGIEECESTVEVNEVCPLSISPNVFKNATKLAIHGDFTDEFIRLSLYDCTGRYVETIFSGKTPSAVLTYHPPSILVSGVYYVLLETAKESFTKSIVIMR